MADPTAAQRRMLAKMHIAMPDGSYYVRNAADLQNAIDSVGRGEDAGDNGNAIRKHIMDRASALKLQSRIPSTWNSDGSLKHHDLDSYLEHFGVKGMRWGVNRRTGTDSPVSEDAKRASTLKSTVRAHGTGALSNPELQHLVTRLQLEKQHGQLNPEHVSAGKKILSETLKIGGNVAKQEAAKYAAQYAVKGIEHLTKKAA
jgi:hypothetical protein